MGNVTGRGGRGGGHGTGSVPGAANRWPGLSAFSHVLRWIREGLPDLPVLSLWARAILPCVGYSVAEVPERRGDGHRDMVRL